MNEGQNSGFYGAASGAGGAAYGGGSGLASGAAGNQGIFGVQNPQGGGNSSYPLGNPQGFPQGDIVLGPPEKKSRKGLFVGVGVLAVAAVIGSVILISVFKSNNENKNSRVEYNDEQIALIKLFEVSEELEKYDGVELSRIYVEENYMDAENVIDQKLATLDREAISYIDEYVEKMTNLVDLISEVAQIYYNDGCEGETIEEFSKCELSDGAEAEALAKGQEAQVSYEEAQHVVEAARKYFNESVGGNE